MIQERAKPNNLCLQRTEQIDGWPTLDALRRFPVALLPHVIRAVGTPLISLGPALTANSLCRGQEKRRMHRPDVQIGNSGYERR